MLLSESTSIRIRYRANTDIGIGWIPSVNRYFLSIFLLVSSIHLKKTDRVHNVCVCVCACTKYL